MQQESYKYWAFISYSHRDQAWAEWLHKALETYRVPRRLVGRETDAGPVPRRLFPVFRDLEELPSSPNLSGAIDQALLQSRYLIVIASPYAAVSKWVDQEIARFRAMGRSDRILCLIVDGEPHADLQPGKGFLECFPPSLRTEDGIEPIAADVRPGKDGKPAIKLKLIAGLLGVGLDELRRRERRRRILQNAGVAMTSLLAVAVLAGLWQMQQREKREALVQQALHAHIETVYEKGRQELLAHNQARAAVYLNEAYRLGVDTPALRFMLARAMRIVDMEKVAFQSGAPVEVVKFSPDSNLLVTNGADSIARVWDTATSNKLWEVPLPNRARQLGPIFSRDSRLMYFGAVEDGAVKGSLRVWDARSGRLLADFNNAPSLDTAFNPFDRGDHHVVHVAVDGAVEIYDLDSSKLVRRLAGAYSVAGFSRDGRHLLVGGQNGDITLWNTTGYLQILALHGIKTRVVSLDDSEDGALLAAAGRDGSIRVWQVDGGVLRLAAAHPSPNPGLIFNIDGSRLLTWASDGARLWNTANGALVYVQQFAGAAGNKVDISSNGRWVMASNSSRLAIQDAQSGAELFTLDGHNGVPQGRDISEDDRSLVTGGPDGRVALWQMPRIPDLEFLHAVDPVRWAAQSRPPGVAAAFSRSGELIVTGGGDGLLKFWDAHTHALKRSIEADSKSVNVLDISQDDSRIATGGEVGGVKIWDVDSGRLLRTLECDGKRVLTVTFNADASIVAAAIRGGITRLWSVESGEQLAAFDRDEPRAGRFSPAGRRFAIGIHGTVKLWDIDRRLFLWSVPLDDGAGKASADIGALDFSDDSRGILAANSDYSAVLLDARDGHLLGKAYDPSLNQISTAHFADGNDLAVLGDRSGAALLWQLSNGKTWMLRGHAGAVRSAVFSPHHVFVLTAGVDGTAKIWDTLTGEQLDTVAEHASQMPEVPFQAASFSPDGRWVLTGSVDGVIRLWEMREETRNSRQIDATLRCRVPWRLDGENLVPAELDSAACSAN